MKKVTIISATYNLIEDNRVEYFKEMCESVRNQTYGNIEHLIIDGASTDGTLKLINEMKELSSKHTFKCISKKDTGIYNAFNNGIRAATGDYIIFMNSDDKYVNNNAIKLLVNSLESDNADFSCGRAHLYCIEGQIGEINVDIDSYIYKIPFIHNTMLCKKELLFEYNLFDENYKLAADYKFMVQVLNDNKKYAIVDEFLTLFRANGASVINYKLSNKEASHIIHKYVFSNFFLEKEVLQIHTRSINRILYLKLKYINKIFKINRHNTPAMKEKLLKEMNFELHKITLKQIIKSIIRFRFIIAPIEYLVKNI